MSKNKWPESIGGPEQLEIEVMAHRYLYYVLCDPVLPDLTYDVLERHARSVCSADSPIQSVGSDLRSSYSDVHVARAKVLNPNPRD